MTSDITRIEEKYFDYLAPNRRSENRCNRGATIECFVEGKYVSAPVIESTAKGARVVLKGASRGDAVQLRLNYNSVNLHGLARVVWTSSLQGEHCVAGLEFVSVWRRSA